MNRPSEVFLGASTICTALLDEGSEARTLLELSAIGRVDLSCTRKVWNEVLLLLREGMVDGSGEPLHLSGHGPRPSASGFADLKTLSLRCLRGTSVRTNAIAPSSSPRATPK